jgi:hypothetical protein
VAPDASTRCKYGVRAELGAAGDAGNRVLEEFFDQAPSRCGTVSLAPTHADSRVWCRQKCLLRSIGIDEARIQTIGRAAATAETGHRLHELRC